MDNQVAEPEVNQDDLRSDLIKEVKGEAPADKKPWEKRLEEDHPELTEVKEVKKETEEVKKVPEEESTSEEQPAKTDSQPLEKEPEEEAQLAPAKDTAKEDAYIAEYAKSSGLSVEDAKEEVSKLKAINTKYGNDPIKLAKAYREMQSGYDKLKVQASSNVNPAVAAIAANPRDYVAGAVKKNADKLIIEFREQNPARSRDMDDEQITEELVERGTSQIKGQIRDYEIQLKKDAFSKREELINSVSESDRRFIPQIKPILEQLPDHQIIGNGFRFEDLVSYAKGKSVDLLIKEAEDRIHKQYATKDRKIVGEISKSAQTTKVKQLPDQSKASGLSKWEKDQAEQMYASTGMSADEKYEAYSELKKKK